MPNVGTYAICPYYDTEERYWIICEGTVTIQSILTKNYMKFQKKADKDTWVKTHCEVEHYNICPYAKLLDKKYEDEERGKHNENNRAKISISYQKTKTRGEGK